MNSNPKDAWYHCGHCGSLFQSDYGFDEDRVCEVCQHKPGVGMWPVVNSINPVASAKVASFHKTGDKVKKLARTPSTKRRRTRRLIVFSLIWMCILLGAVGVRYFLTKDQSMPRILTVADLDRDLTAKDKEKILNQVLPECDRALSGFLADSSIEERMRFISKATEFGAVLEIHEKNHPYLQMDEKSLQRTAQEWLRLGDEWMVLTRWKDAGGHHEFDAVFRKEGDAWKLDWPHFSQYSQASWKLFLAGEGKFDSAEFRLLARIHDDTDTSRLKEQRMMIVLAEPVWGKPSRVLNESGHISIDTMGDEGKMLKAAFQRRAQNLTVGGGELAPLTPDGFVNVRVKVMRDELDGELRLTIHQLKACHWLDSDLSGF
jgi:hypothetical protein